MLSNFRREGNREGGAIERVREIEEVCVCEREREREREREMERVRESEGVASAPAPGSHELGHRNKRHGAPGGTGHLVACPLAGGASSWLGWVTARRP
jgi:hypothetical protein